MWISNFGRPPPAYVLTGGEIPHRRPRARDHQTRNSTDAVRVGDLPLRRAWRTFKRPSLGRRFARSSVSFRPRFKTRRRRQFNSVDDLRPAAGPGALLQPSGPDGLDAFGCSGYDEGRRGARHIIGTHERRRDVVRAFQMRDDERFCGFWTGAGGWRPASLDFAGAGRVSAWRVVGARGAAPAVAPRAAAALAVPRGWRRRRPASRPEAPRLALRLAPHPLAPAAGAGRGRRRRRRGLASSAADGMRRAPPCAGAPRSRGCRARRRAAAGRRRRRRRGRRPSRLQTDSAAGSGSRPARRGGRSGAGPLVGPRGVGCLGAGIGGSERCRVGCRSASAGFGAADASHGRGRSC